MTAMPDTRTLVIERELAFPPEKVWRALTEGSLIQQWLMENDFKAEVGHKFNFRSKPVQGWDGIIESEVLIVESGKSISYRWNSMGLESVVEWTLTPTATGTHVRMEQSGFRPDQEFAYKGASYGWQNFLGGLERIVAGLES